MNGHLNINYCCVGVKLNVCFVLSDIFFLMRLFKNSNISESERFDFLHFLNCVDPLKEFFDATLHGQFGAHSVVLDRHRVHLRTHVINVKHGCTDRPLKLRADNI